MTHLQSYSTIHSQNALEKLRRLPLVNPPTPLFDSCLFSWYHEVLKTNINIDNLFQIHFRSGIRGYFGRYISLFLYQLRINLLVWHLSPLHPGRQLHLYLLTPSAQNPPFRHGLDAHSLISGIRMTRISKCFYFKIIIPVQSSQIRVLILGFWPHFNIGLNPG